MVNTDTYIEEKFPVKEVLILYLNHRKFFYPNYFKTFRLLTAWLGFMPVHRDAVQSKGNWNLLPWYVRGNYELSQLSLILGTDIEIIWNTIKELENSHPELGEWK